MLSPKPLPSAPQAGDDDLVQSFNALALARKPDNTFNTTPIVVQTSANDSLRDRFKLKNAFHALTGKRRDERSSSSRDVVDIASRLPPARPTFSTPYIPSVNNGLLRVNPGPLPRPPAFVSMPTPQIGQQSLTMQHALSTLNTPFQVDSSSQPYLAPHGLPPRPHSENVLSPNAAHRPSASVSPAGSPNIRIMPTRPRAASAPPSPTTSSRGSTVQCSAYTQQNKRCGRRVKVTVLPLTALDPDSQSEIELFCHQHRPQILQSSGAHINGKNGSEWIEFKEYVGEYLQPDTQAALRTEMTKPISASDVPGYIYAYEILDPADQDVIKLKVGRAVKLQKRLNQWEKMCGSKEQVIRGWWPGTVGSNVEHCLDHDDNPANSSAMKGLIRAGPQGPLCHRLERLIHLELSDLALHAPYLHRDWPKIVSPPKDPGCSRSPRRQDTPCPDCDIVHREIFAFPRAKRADLKGKEWDLIVKPVIQKWGAFVRKYDS